MTIRNRTSLKNISENGDTADANLFTDIIDSAVNLSDTTAQSMSSDLQAPRFIATTEVSAAGHTLAASAVSFAVPTTVATTAHSSADRYIKVNINGTAYYLYAVASA